MTRFALLTLLTACALDDDCEEMCDAAAASFAACLDDRGESWGAPVGYTSPTDYAGWCETYSWELRELGEAGQCARILDAVTGADCAGYANAWETAP